MAEQRKTAKKTVKSYIALYAILIFVGFQAFMLLFISNSKISTGSFALNNLNPFSHWGISPSDSSIGLYSKVPLTNDGYQQTLVWDRTIQETPDLQKQIAGFDVLIPCCGFKLSSANPNADCQCGHHLAMRGIIKYGLTHGWTRDQIQQELNQWKPIYYPECKQNPKICDL